MTALTRLAAAAAISAALAAGFAGAASAAWQTTGPGTSTAKAGTVAAPGMVSISASSCNGNVKNTSATLTWSAVAGAAGYQILTSVTGAAGSFTVAATSAGSTATIAPLPGKPSYFEVAATVGNWMGTPAPSSPASAC